MSSYKPSNIIIYSCLQTFFRQYFWTCLQLVLSISARFERRETLRESVDQAWVCECLRKLAVYKYSASQLLNYRGFASRLFHALTQSFTAFEVS